MSATSEQLADQCVMVDINLDHLADAYRLRPLSFSARKRAAAAAESRSGWLLDIGGGVGEHAAVWNAKGQHPIVIDPSRAMLAKARSHPRVQTIRARSQHLPLRDRTAELAYFHLSIHYGEWRTALDEAARVTKLRGRIEIWTIDPGEIASSALGRWFPSVIDIDSLRFPDPQEIGDRLAAGGRRVDVSRWRESIDRTAGEWMDAVRARFVSTLQVIDDEEIARGLARFSKVYPDRDAPYRYELSLTRIRTSP